MVKVLWAGVEMLDSQHSLLLFQKVENYSQRKSRQCGFDVVYQGSVTPG
jgi:hypothetical protein